MSPRRLLAITMGDPAGVGPEVCLKAIYQCRSSEFAFVLIGDAGVLQLLAQRSGLPLPKTATTWEQASTIAQAEGAAVWHIHSLGMDWLPGQISAQTGLAAFRYIQTAIATAMDGLVGAVVTAPIHKEALRAAGVLFPGHTEIFESLTGAERTCMMLTSEAVTCAFVTTHVGLAEVPRLITRERVLDVIELTHDAIRAIKLGACNLVVCGLNPHAGERGLFGNREEEEVIAPAVETARQRGVSVVGPLPPDTAFLSARRARTDAYICMYHDQGHIPLKALSFETAVNVTLGLPIVRTSVDHGTALDIAWGSYNADPTSMLRAIELSQRLCAASLADYKNEQQPAGAHWSLKPSKVASL